MTVRIAENARARSEEVRTRRRAASVEDENEITLDDEKERDETGLTRMTAKDAVYRAGKFLVVVVMMGAMKLAAFAHTGLMMIPIARRTNAHGKTEHGVSGPRIPRLVEFMYKWSMFNYVVFGIPMPLFWVRFLLRRYEALNASAPDAETQRVPEVDWTAENFSHEKFFETYVKRPHPVVLRGFGRDLPAFGTFTVDEFCKAFGEEDVLLKTLSADGVKGKLRDIKNPGTYLHNSEALFVRHPELIDALKLERMKPFGCDALANDHPIFGRLPVQLFLGLGGTGTPFHCANGYNWYFQLEGKKKWTFVDPKWIGFMVPACQRGALYQTSAITDPNTVLEKYKALWRVVPRFEVILEPGDVLLNPPWWWHCIENMSSKSTACATRWADTSSLRPILGMGHDTNRLFTNMQLFAPKFIYMQIQLIMAGGTGAFVDEHTKVPGDEKSKSGVKVQHESATRVTKALLDNDEQRAYKAYYAKFQKHEDDNV